MKKDKFIKILKNVSETLEKEEIKYDIPFSYINRDEFEEISIIIPDHVAIYDITRMFNVIDIKEKSGIISVMIDDIMFDFVKTSEMNWWFTFFYYSWDITHILVDILLFENFNLKYENVGMKFHYKEKVIPITKNLFEIFDFLELKFFMINKGFPTLESIFMFIESSPYFNSEDFTMENFEIYDKNFKYNKQMYEKLIKHKPDTTIVKKTNEEKIVYIDVCFPSIKFLEKIYKTELKAEYPGLKEITIKPDVEKVIVEEKIKRKKIKLGSYRKDDPDFDYKIVD